MATIAEPVEEAAATTPVVAEAAPTDLADVRAGAAARAQARAAKEAAPVRTMLARVLRVHNDERAWRIGADGEEMVAARLAKLAGKDPRWKFLHAVPVGERGSDIDHVVIGPGGVFTLNAKHHPKAKIWIGGETMMVKRPAGPVRPELTARGEPRRTPADGRLRLARRGEGSGRPGERLRDHRQGGPAGRDSRAADAVAPLAAQAAGRPQ